LGKILVQTRIIERFCPPGDGICLDLGCGEGPYKDLLIKRGYTYIGLDIKHQGGIKDFILGDAHRLPFRRASVKLVLATHVLEHLLNPQKVVDEVYQILENKGKFIIIVPFAHPPHGDYFRFTELGLLYILRRFKIVVLKPAGGIFTVLGIVMGNLVAKIFGKDSIIRFVRDSFSRLDNELTSYVLPSSYFVLAVKE